MTNKQESRARRRRMMVWTYVFIMIAAVAIPTGGYLFSQTATAQNAEAESNPRSNFWRTAREGLTGYTSVSGQETNVLIQNGGQNWRAVRNGPVQKYTKWVLPIVLGIIALFFLLKGKIKIEGGRSGVKVPRWNVFERFMHWFTAILFVILAITGLSLMFGKAVLIPIVGKVAFAGWAQLSISLHNYLGPFFTIGVVAIILFWMKNNLPAKGDLTWLKQGGGIIGNKHPSAGKANAGEKIWFWIICTFGVAVCVSGLVLDFPNFGQSRDAMQLANTVHAICAIIWMAVFLGHVYIGTIGTEGALEGMTTGSVDSAWAQQHHDQWYDQIRGGGHMASSVSGGVGSGGSTIAPTDSVLRRHHESALRYSS